MMYSYPNEEVNERTSLGLIVHHPKFGIALKQQLDQLGVECVVQYPDRAGGRLVRHGGGEPVTAVEFIRKHFERASGR
jgi:hypothetical protein